MSTTDSFKHPASGYAPPGEKRPLPAYGALIATFGAGLAGALVALRPAGRDLPEHVRAGDLLLAGVTTHKVSRLLTKDRVTSFVRAPFAFCPLPGARGSRLVEEEARGTGLRLAVGELLVCPFCISQWVSAGFMVGLVAAPRTTRFIGAVYVAETVSDVLQLAYKAAEDRA